jgi:hypothetical protein
MSVRQCSRLPGKFVERELRKYSSYHL